jgi:predicted phosphodiesterase
MTNNRTIKGDIVIKILEKFPNTSHRQLARMLYRDNPLVFKDENEAYTRVRYYSGSSGKFNQKHIANKNLFRDREVGEMLKNNPFGLPASDMDNWKPLRFPIQEGRVLGLWDGHIPYHDQRAITIALQWGIDNGYTDGVFLGGDWMDCYQLSRFDRDPTKKKFIDELEDFKRFLDAIGRAYPNADIIWKHGNHESHLERYFKVKAPELFGLDKFIWNKFLDLEQRGVTIVEHDVPLYVGKLNIIHGHELRGSNSQVNPARGAYLKAVECVIEGHWHRTSMHAETSFSRRLDTCWSVGCLCSLYPEYSRINKWNHGFAGMEIHGKDFDIENKRIVQGTVR